MKYLLVPGNNSLSHAAKALAIREEMLVRGHEVLIAVSRGRSRFLESLGIPHAILPDIQDTDGAGFPGVEWFRRPRSIAKNIEAERQLISDYRPDRVLGVFRFTLKASAELAGVPFDSLICGCMLPCSTDALGFATGERGSDTQKKIMSGFFRYSGLRISQALASFGLAAIDDCRRMLVGERTFLWDFPEFMPIAPVPGVVHAGPIFWDQWPYDKYDWDGLETGDRPLAVVSFGTCNGHAKGTERLAAVLGGLGYHVLITGGGMGLTSRLAAESWLTLCEFAPLQRILPNADLLVSHGGQMSIFEAIANEVPIVVMPFQPEQAHNGVCLERMGCGGRLVPGQVFLGDSAIYTNALEQKRDVDLAEAITGLASGPGLAVNLAAARWQMSRYRGVKDLVPLMEVE